MSLLPIRIYPDPVLRQQAVPVTRFDGELRELAAAMIETMYGAPGVGLAAPQVGRSIRLAVVDAGEAGERRPHTLVNPEILAASGSETDIEGCLSIPDFTERVPRPLRLHVRAQDLEGREFEIHAEGFEARVLSHEIDHLDGILFTDRLRGLRRERARRFLRRLATMPEGAGGDAA